MNAAEDERTVWFFKEALKRAVNRRYTGELHELDKILSLITDTEVLPALEEYVEAVKKSEEVIIHITRSEANPVTLCTGQFYGNTVFRHGKTVKLCDVCRRLSLGIS